MKCAYCGHNFNSMKELNKRKPRKGYGNEIVCEGCWEAYLKNCHHKYKF